MPGRKAKPARLWYRESDDIWIILDRGRQVRTGCRRDEVSAAEQALTDYLAKQHQPAVGVHNPAKLPIADALTFYEELKRPLDYDPEKPRGGESEPCRRHDELVQWLDKLNTFFGSFPVSQIKGELCRDYVDWRTHAENKRNRFRVAPPERPVAASTARRELEMLRAAVNAYHAEHTLDVVPVITLPAKAPGRDRWLTRNEAARMLGAALGFVWDTSKGSWKRTEDGKLYRRDRMTRARRRHIARFFLIGVYSARREHTIRRTLWTQSVASPWLDMNARIYHGRGREERKTKKRRPPARIADRLFPHLERWNRLDAMLAAKLGRPVQHVVHRPDGGPLREKIKTGWDGCLRDAGLGKDVVRHILRHTAATWVMQKGPKNLWLAAGWLGMTEQQLEDGYAHHHPDFQKEAAGAFGGRT